MNQETDLIRRACAGDDAAYTLLVEQHQEAVFRLAYLLLGDPGEADDIAQETFIHAFRALNGFDLARPLRPWLLRIARNLAYNRRRSARRYLSALQKLLVGETLREPPPDDQWEVKALREAVNRLEQADQDVIYLRFFLELSVEETAEVLKIAPGTVKSRLHRALQRLRPLVEFPTLYRTPMDE